MIFLLDTNVCVRYLNGKSPNLRQKFQTVQPYDLLIASIALANNLILVTHNTSEFSRVSGLNLEDWEANP